MSCAYMHEEDGQRWLRIDQCGEVWDEPIKGWTLILDLTNGLAYWRHTDGREIPNE